MSELLYRRAVSCGLPSVSPGMTRTEITNLLHFMENVVDLVRDSLAHAAISELELGTLLPTLPFVSYPALLQSLRESIKQSQRAQSEALRRRTL